MDKFLISQSVNFRIELHLKKASKNTPPLIHQANESEILVGGSNNNIIIIPEFGHPPSWIHLYGEIYYPFQVMQELTYQLEYSHNFLLTNVSFLSQMMSHYNFYNRKKKARISNTSI